MELKKIELKKSRAHSVLYIQKKYIFKAIFIFLIALFPKVFSTDFLITISGHYELGDNLMSDGDSNGTIRIQASHVILDLGGFVVQQTSNTSNAGGIVVDPGLTDIQIRNGTIFNFTGTGIAVGAGCSEVIIDNILTESCFFNGITFNGTTTAAGLGPVTDSQVKNCRINRCANSLSTLPLDQFISYPAFWMVNSERVLLSNITVNNSGIFRDTTLSSLYAAFQVESCSNCIIENVNLSGNYSCSGIALTQYKILSAVSGIGEGPFTKGCIVRNCSVSGTLGTLQNSGTQYGFLLYGASNNVIADSSIVNNSNSSGNLSGFRTLGAVSQYNSFLRCIVSGNNKIFSPLVFNDSNNSAINCIVNNNVNSFGFAAASGTASGANNCSFISCIISNNVNQGGGLSGLSISSNNNLIQDCKVFSNAGSTDANTFGIRNLGSNNLFLRNIAYRNGPTSPILANQNSGVPVGSFVAPGGTGSSASLNEVTSVLSNVSIIS